MGPGPCRCSPFFDEDDEYTRFYKTYRPECGICPSSPSFSFANGTGNLDILGNRSPWKHSSTRTSWYQTLKKKFKLRSKSTEEWTRHQSRQTVIAKIQACSSSSSSPTSPSPLGGIRTMLSDKMTLSSFQSRDAGDSSCGGSPDLRGLRLGGGRSRSLTLSRCQEQDTKIMRGDTAAIFPPQLPYRRNQNRVADEYCYSRRLKTEGIQSAPCSVELDVNSTCCNEAVRDLSYFSPISTYTTQTYPRGFGGDPSEPGVESKLESWCPGGDDAAAIKTTSSVNSVKKGNAPYISSSSFWSIEESLRQSSDVNPNLPRRRHTPDAMRTIATWCFRLCLLFKMLIGFMSGGLLLLAFLFAFRSWYNDNYKLRTFDLDHLSADLMTNGGLNEYRPSENSAFLKFEIAELQSRVADLERSAKQEHSE